MGEVVPISRATSFDVMVLLAAEDPDLVAKVELDRQGFTDVPLSETRQDVLQDLSPGAVLQDVQASYELSPWGAVLALGLAIQDYRERNPL